MRFFRFAGIVITLLMAYAALLLLNPNTVADLPSTGVFARLAAFYPLLDQLIPYRALLASLAVITFGLLTVPWPVAPWPPSDAVAPSTGQPAARQQRHWVGRSLVLLGLMATGGALTRHWLRAEEDLTSQLLWAVGVLVYLLACGRLGSTRKQKTTSAPLDVPQPRAWPALVLLLLAALFYLGWGLTTLPMQLDASIVDAGLQTVALATAPVPQLFAPQRSAATNQDTTPLTDLGANLALVGAALITWLHGNLLLSMRLVGLASALLFGLSIWLLSRELFRRPGQLLVDVTYVDGRGMVIHPREDNGSWPSLVATLLALSSSATLIFSRHPFLLAVTAAGTLSCWALLRAWRTRDRLAVGLSGTLLGFAVACHLSSWSFVGVSLCWWLGIVAADHGWLPHLAGRAAQQEQSDTATPRRLGVADFLLWLLGIFVVMAPFGLGLLTARVDVNPIFNADFPPQLGVLLRNLYQAVMPAGPVTGLNSMPLFHPWLVPLMLLALGSLFFNLDRKQGWMILSWSAVAVLWVGIVAVVLGPFEQNTLALGLPLVPPLAVAVAFALDRLYITLLRAGGGWLQQFWSYGVLGLLLWVIFQNGTAYYIAALNQYDSISALGQTLREAERAESLIVIDPNAALATAQARNELQVLTTGRGVAFTDLTVVSQIPSELAPGTTVILFGTDRSSLDTVRTQHPQGVLTTRRAIDANRLLYLYQLP